MSISTVGTIMSLSEAAERTGIPLSTLRHYRTTGRGGPPTFRVGRRVMVREADLERWLVELYEADTSGAGLARVG